MKLEKPKCNLCGKNGSSVFLESIGSPKYPDKFILVKCDSCDLVFLSPRPVKAGIIKHYPEESYWGVDLEGKSGFDIESSRKKLYGEIYKRLLRRKSGRIFDIGAGIGLFLSKLDPNDWKVDGCELSRGALKYAGNNFGLRLRKGDFNDIKIEADKYDVVSFINSLEHLYDPESAIKKAYSILKSNGQLIIVVPNIDSLSFTLFKEYWIPLQPPIHLYHFSSSTLRCLLNNSGFEIQWLSKWHYIHAYYAFFESFRNAFKSKIAATLRRKGDSNLNIETKKNLLKNLLITGVSILSFILVLIEFLIGKGQTITVIAKKV